MSSQRADRGAPSLAARGRRTGGSGLLGAAAVLVVALNLRPAVTSVGPLLDEVRADLGTSAAWAGALTTVPVLCFAAAGLVTPALARRIGTAATVAAALALIAVGLAARVAGG